MSVLLNVGRMVMLVWLGFALVLLFRPSLVHLQSNPTSAIIQALVAFVLGHLIERALGTVRRRQADAATAEGGQI